MGELKSYADVPVVLPVLLQWGFQVQWERSD